MAASNKQMQQRLDPFLKYYSNFDRLLISLQRQIWQGKEGNS